jgi:bla regulator protein blaR1
MAARVVALTAAVGALLTAGVVVRAQIPSAPDASAPTFEVASIKPADPGAMRIGMNFSPGGVNVMGMPVRSLIQNAYRLQNYELLNVPAWAESDRFDITARMSKPDATPDERLAMMRSLLRDRFNLKAHTESRELPRYRLLFARDDKRLGPGLQRSTVDCQAQFAGRRGQPPPPPPAPAAPGQLPPPPECGVMMGMTPNGAVMRGGMAFADLVRMISTNLGRAVIDETGLTGFFNIDLRFSSDRGPLMPGMPPPPPRGGGPGRGDGPAAGPSLEEAPSLMTALQEQLGLKVESDRGTVPVLVVDSVDRPTAD